MERDKRLLVGVVLLALVSCSAATRICMNMIAKNEGERIMSGLNALADELSGWTLCDTGSTDDTIRLVEDFFEEHDVPGMVTRHAWKNFGHNRDECYKEGVRWSLEEAKRQGMPEGHHYCEYIMFLDADQILERPDGIQPGAIKAMDLTADSYYMMDRSYDLAYKNLRLASTRLEWQWVGEVHEYIHCKSGQTPGFIDGYWLRHDSAGGQDGKRFERDEVILLKAVEERPTDPRARFYLGNTLRALDKTEDAIMHYTERIRLGGWEEECFMSALNIANLVKKQWEKGQIISSQVKAAIGNWNAHVGRLDKATEDLEQQQMDLALAAYEAAANATTDQNDARLRHATQLVDSLKKLRKDREIQWVVSAYLAASMILPYRPEPWAILARLYRVEKSDFAKCYSYAAAGLAQGAPQRDALFLNTNAANYDILDELCVCGYYVEHHVTEGHAACSKVKERLVAGLAQAPTNTYYQGMLNRVNQNLEWYAKKWPEKVSKAPDSCDTSTKAIMMEK